MISTYLDPTILSESTSPRMRIAVLGGGIAGATLAAELSKSDAIDVTIFEKDDVLGGLHRSSRIEGCTYDIGTFVFPGDHEMFASFPGIGRAFTRIEFQPAAIRKKGSIDRYPLSISGYVRDFGVAEAVRSGLDLVRHRWKRNRPTPLPEHIARFTGNRIYVNSG